MHHLGTEVAHIGSSVAAVLALLHADTPDDARAVAAIADRDKQLFRQEAVLHMRTPACMSL